VSRFRSPGSEIEPREKEVHWDALRSLGRVGGEAPHSDPRYATCVPLPSRSIPDWLYIWEHDFDAVRDLVYEHLRRLIIGRYGQYINVWDVISGIHANNCFSFNFEQLMELTRMAAAVTKQLAPRATAMVDIVTPLG
jgi:hypothetical protein